MRGVSAMLGRRGGCCVMDRLARPWAVRRPTRRVSAAPEYFLCADSGAIRKSLAARIGQMSGAAGGRLKSALARPTKGETTGEQRPTDGSAPVTASLLEGARRI